MKMGNSYYIICFLFILSSLNVISASDTLRVAYTSAPPFIIDSEDINGIGVWLWDKVARDIDQPYELIQLDFLEMLDSLEAGTIDVSINPLTITSDRMNKMDFTLPFYTAHATAVVRDSTGWAQVKNFLSAIFNMNFIRVVTGLFFLIGVFGLAVWLFERKKNPTQFRNSPKGIWDGLWWSAVTMTTVGYGDKAPKSRGGKLIALVWMFSGLIFISGFTASIASILTVHNLTNEVNGLDDFKEKKVGTMASTSTLQFLKFNFFKNITTFNNLSHGLDALKNAEIDAFIYDQPILNYRITQSEQYDQLNILPLKFNAQFYAFGIPKDREDLRQKISSAILHEIESNEWQLVLNEYGCGEQ